jgi:Domain of unknown function (DUF4145)
MTRSDPKDPDAHRWDLEVMEYPDCHRLTARLRKWQIVRGDAINTFSPIIYPKVTVRAIPEEVTGEFRQDYEQACAVLDLSPMASAALSRRLLQHILREKAGVRERTLAAEIDKVLESDHRPPYYLAEDLHRVRKVGNFAAHPIKDEVSEAIVEVEPGEAEWLLDLVGQLLDFYIVGPAIAQEMRDQLDVKGKKAPEPDAEAEAEAGG